VMTVAGGGRRSAAPAAPAAAADDGAGTGAVQLDGGERARGAAS
jgi:hypothetical protein